MIYLLFNVLGYLLLMFLLVLSSYNLYVKYIVYRDSKNEDVEFLSIAKKGFTEQLISIIVYILLVIFYFLK